MTAPPFQRFMDTHKHDVYRFLVALIGPDDADDCFQETFIAALGAYRSLKNDDNLKGWIFTIAHRKALDEIKSRRTRPAPTELTPDAADEEEAPPKWIWAIAGRLPDKQRMAIVYRYAAEMTFKEVAARMEISEVAARKNVSEGVKTMREALKR